MYKINCDSTEYYIYLGLSFICFPFSLFVSYELMVNDLVSVAFWIFMLGSINLIIALYLPIILLIMED